jgi:hypothetical protein
MAMPGDAEPEQSEAWLGKARRGEPLALANRSLCHDKRGQRYLSALLSDRGAWVAHLNLVYCALLFMGHELRKSVAF